LIVVPTARIERHANRIAKLSRYATRGGVILAGVGVALSCRDIANTDDQQEKNEILVETATSTIVGFGSSAVIAIALLSNLVGWTMAIMLGAGAAAASYSAGKYFRHSYSILEKPIDFASVSGIDELCK